MHQIIDSSLHWTPKVSGGPKHKEILNDENKITLARVEEHFRFKPKESQTHEGKFNWLITQEQFVLTP